MGMTNVTAIRPRLFACANGLGQYTECFIVFDLDVQSMQWLTLLQVCANQTSCTLSY